MGGFSALRCDPGKATVVVTSVCPRSEHKTNSHWVAPPRAPHALAAIVIARVLVCVRVCVLKGKSNCNFSFKIVRGRR